MCRALYKRGFEQPISQSIAKEKSRNIANIGIQSYVTKFSQKYFMRSVYCTALCRERFEPLHSLNTSKKKLGHITNINIWSYHLKFSEQTVLYSHFTALCYVQDTRKKLKIASFIDHTMLLNLVKKSVLYFLFCFAFIALSYVQGELVINL